MLRQDERKLKEKLKNQTNSIAEIAARCGAPSTSVGVLHHGQVEFSESVGFRDGDPRHPATDESIYLLGSISKGFVAAAIGVLVEDEKLDWFDLVSKHLPEFDPKGDPEIGKNADFIDLLRLSTGLGNPVVQIIGPYGTIIGPEDKFMDLVNATETKDEHGEQRFNRAWEYSNISYAIGALAVEKISGISFAEFVKHRILTPLGMDQTIVTKAELDATKNIADGHALLDDGTWLRVPVEWTSEENTSVLAPYGMRSSIHDMLIWSAAWLAADAKLEGPSLPQALKNISFNPLRQVHRIMKPAWEMGIEESDSEPATYCLGWMRATMPTSTVNWGALNLRTISDKTHLGYMLGTKSPPRVMLKHTGIAYNTTSAIFLFPESQSAVVAMSNGRRRGDASDFAAQLLIQELFDLQPRVDILSRVKIETERAVNFRHNTAMLEWLKNRDVTGQEKPQEFVGIYQAPGTELHVNIERETNRLMLHFNNRADKPVRLEYFNKNIYSFFPTTTDQHFSEGFMDFDHYTIGLLYFQRDKHDAVDGLSWTWETESPPTYFKRLSHGQDTASRPQSEEHVSSKGSRQFEVTTKGPQTAFTLPWLVTIISGLFGGQKQEP